MSIQKQLKGSNVQIKIHLGSITPSRAIMLNSENLHVFKAIAYDIVFAEDQTNKIYAYPYEGEPNSYLILIPINQHEFQQLIFNQFIVLLCIFARTVTLPIDKQFKNLFIKIMDDSSITGVWKKGNNYYKVFLDGSARISSMDLESFQMTQYKERTIEQILQIKIKNAYLYSLNYFKSEIIIDLYDCQEENISQIYESKMIQIQEMYGQLAARDRIQIDVKLKDNKYLAENLKSQIKDLILARNTKTIADQQFEEAIYEGLQTIFQDKFKMFSGELDKIKQKKRKHDEEICVYSKILSEILKSLRQYDIQINDEKYLYLTQKINEKILLNSGIQKDEKQNKNSKNEKEIIQSTTKSILLCEHNKKCLKTKQVLKKSKSSLKNLVHQHKKQKQKYFETIHIKQIQISRLRQKLAELEKQKAKIELQTRRFGPTLAEIKQYPLKLTPKVRKVASQKKLVDRSLEFGSLKLYEKQNETAKATQTQSHNVSTRADKESKKEKIEFSKNQIAKKKNQDKILVKKESEIKKTKPALSKKALNVA